MKQTIEIEVPDGKKAICKDNKVVFEDKHSLPKDWEEYFTFHFPKTGKLPENHYVWANTEVFFDCPTNSDYISLLQTKNILTSDIAAKQHFALMQLHQLRDCYRQGWKPNWNDSSYKYCIDNYRNCYTTHKYQSLKHFLAFQSKEIAEEFLNNFRELIEEAGDLI